MTGVDQILAPGALSTRFQPIVAERDGKRDVFALECLTRGPVGSNFERADILFEYARLKGVEPMLDRACIAQALTTARTIGTTFDLALNVHASTLTRTTNFTQELVAAAEASGFAAEQIILEIVEQAPVLNRRDFLLSLSTLRAAGFRIALDDVGHGHSNFAMMLDARPHFLKIDRDFTGGAARDTMRAAVLESIVGFASRAGARVVAEGVEREEDRRYLSRLGIELMQGYLFARPMTADSVARYSTSGNPTSSEGATMSTKKKILLVDDSQTVLLMEKMILSKGPYSVVTASNGEEAVLKATAEKPDLILLDVVMPKMNGFEACRALRAQDATSLTPIIMVTTRGEEPNVEAGYASGCSDYITKPINGPELLAKLRGFLGE